MPLLTEIGGLSGSTTLGTMSAADISMRVVADHISATTFLIGDGVIPSNEWRGYVLRKIMRRAMRHGKHLGVSEPFLHQLVGILVHEMGDAYPDIRTHREVIEKTILAEEKRFDAVLSDGLPRLEAEITKVLEAPERTLPGDVAFRLYDTFGVPYDFIEDTAATHDVRVDKAGYELAMDAQRGKGRAQGAFGGDRTGEEFAIKDEAPLKDAGDQFDGYATVRMTQVPVLALFDEARTPVDELATGAIGYAALARTPFYLESGGQVSDSGRIVNESREATALVEGLARIRPGLPRAHRIRVSAGALKVRDIVTAEVDVDMRDATRRNHTATHLLHAALRQVLGTTREARPVPLCRRIGCASTSFTFSRSRAKRSSASSSIVNEQIIRNTPVTTEVRSTEEAVASGAMALFGEKYGDKVRVVSVPGFSVGLCGGTHVATTGDIGLFVIGSEAEWLRVFAASRP